MAVNLTDNEEDEKEFSEKAKRDFRLIALATATDDDMARQKAYGELMKHYYKSVYHTMLKMIRNTDDAEDLTIEAFAKAFKSLGNFKQDFTFSTWLFRIATNNCIDFIRKRRLDTMSINTSFTDDNGDPVELDIKDDNLNPQDEAINEQKKALIRNIVGLLPAKYQQLVQLRYFDELSYEEIATEIDAPLGTVKAQLHRARELLYDLVKGKKDVI